MFEKRNRRFSITALRKDSHSPSLYPGRKKKGESSGLRDHPAPPSCSAPSFVRIPMEKKGGGPEYGGSS